MLLRRRTVDGKMLSPSNSNHDEDETLMSQLRELGQDTAVREAHQSLVKQWEAEKDAKLRKTSRQTCEECGGVIVTKLGDSKTYRFCSEECQRDHEQTHTHMQSLTVDQLYREIAELKEVLWKLEEEKRQCLLQMAHLEEQGQKKSAMIKTLRTGEHAQGLPFERVRMVFGINNHSRVRAREHEQRSAKKNAANGKNAKQGPHTLDLGDLHIPQHRKNRRGRSASNLSDSTASTRTRSDTVSSWSSDESDDAHQQALGGFTRAFRKKVLESAASTGDKTAKWKRNVYGVQARRKSSKAEELNKKFATLGESMMNGTYRAGTSSSSSSSSSVISSSTTSNSSSAYASPRAPMNRSGSFRSFQRGHSSETASPRAEKLVESILNAYENPQAHSSVGGKRRPRSMSMHHSANSPMRRRDK